MSVRNCYPGCSGRSQLKQGWSGCEGLSGVWKSSHQSGSLILLTAQWYSPRAAHFTLNYSLPKKRILLAKYTSQWWARALSLTLTYKKSIFLDLSNLKSLAFPISGKTEKTLWQTYFWMYYSIILRSISIFFLQIFWRKATGAQWLNSLFSVCHLLETFVKLFLNPHCYYF